MGRRGVLLLALTLSGCATALPYGNFLRDPMPETFHARLASDTVTHVLQLYPPANTRVTLQHPMDDPYGTTLVDTLRLKGYAVSEYRPEATWSRQSLERSEPPTPSRPVSPEATGVTLRYVLDGPFEAHLYRLTVLIGSQTLSRAYRVRNGGFTPAGAWVRKE
jgi:hypothetical protein